MLYSSAALLFIVTHLCGHAILFIAMGRISVLMKTSSSSLTYCACISLLFYIEFSYEIIKSIWGFD